MLDLVYFIVNIVISSPFKYHTRHLHLNDYKWNEESPRYKLAEIETFDFMELSDISILTSSRERQAQLSGN